MNLKLALTKTLAVGILTLSLSNVSHAQYGADSATLAPGGPLDPVGVRLFTDAGFTTAAPLNSVIWFVASVDNTFNTSPIAGSGGGPGGILGLDDSLILIERIDGVDGAAGAGTFIRDANNGGNAILGIPAQYASQNIAVYLWNVVDATPNDFVPVAGNQFGLLNLGVRTPPPVGNADWNITQNMFSTQYTVAAVPEPSTYAMLLLGGLGVLGYRRFKK